MPDSKHSAEMVERVARVICVALEENPDGMLAGGHLTEPTAAWKARFPAARAAIEAMREPTEAMCAAAANKDHLYDRDDPPSWRIAAGYTCMIDAALMTDTAAPSAETPHKEPDLKP